MTLDVEDEDVIRAALRDEIKRYAAETSIKVDPDWKGWIMVALGIMGTVAAFTMFVFKTNAAADLEHQKITSTHVMDLRLHTEELNSQKQSQQKTLDKLDTLTTNQIRIGERLKVGGLKGNDDEQQ